jgi:hypothetical protein
MEHELITLTLPHPIYNFRASQLKEIDYGQYRLVNVFNMISERERRECTEMWLNNGALDSESQAYDRSREVCYMLYSKADNILIGVNTIYTDIYRLTNTLYYFNRLFISPGYRNSRLMILATAATLCFLHANHDKQIYGVININENTKLHRKHLHATFLQAGYILDISTPDIEVFRYEFSRIMFIEDGNSRS